MSWTPNKREEQRQVMQQRQADILAVCNGLTRMQIREALPQYRGDTIDNDIAILKRQNKMRSESTGKRFVGGGQCIYFAVHKTDPDLVLAECPVAMWGGYGAITPAAGREYEMDDFKGRSEPLRKSRVHISGGTLEMIG